MAAELIVRFKLEGAAFGLENEEELTPECQAECARILRKIADQCLEGDMFRLIFDRLGNPIGSWSI